MEHNVLFFYRTARDFLSVYLPKQRGASPNTVKSYLKYAAGKDKSLMDYIEGISFKTYIANQGGKVSVEEALDGNVKLQDFGSARYSIGDKSKSLDVILKVGYAPKEQYIRRSHQSPNTDVYSCAACFYAALTGFLPPESLERMDEDILVPVSQCGGRSRSIWTRPS